MADTIREQILQEFSNRLQPLTPETISRDLPTLPEGNEIMIVIAEGEEIRHDESTYQTTRLNLPVVIDAAVKTATPSITINEILGDIIRAITNADISFGGLANVVRYDGSPPDYRADGSSYSSIQIIFNVDYQFNKGDPYTAG